MPLLRHALRASFAVRFGILPPQSGNPCRNDGFLLSFMLNEALHQTTISNPHVESHAQW